MIDETTPRFFITGVSKDNEQLVINKLERSGFTNWWELPEDGADYIYVSKTLGNKYMKHQGNKIEVDFIPKITAEEYLSEEVSK